MAKRPKTQKNDNGPTIEDLDNYMLTEILCRVPSFVTILACKPVSKRWCCLISDPRFAVHFSKHKKQSTAVSAVCQDIIDNEPPWTFLVTMATMDIPFRHRIENSCSSEEIFGSPKFSLKFLPCAVNVEATFKDLVLCSGTVNRREGTRAFYICNPLTTQWVALPPAPDKNQWRFRSWASLVCEQPYNFTKDFKFRVVVLLAGPPDPVQHIDIHNKTCTIFDIVVYCSEIAEWRQVDLSLPVARELVHESFDYAQDGSVRLAVCNGILCLQYRIYFGAFDPFNVNATSGTTLEGRALPLPPGVLGYLQVSMGQLFMICFAHEVDLSLRYRKKGKAVQMPLIIWKMKLSEVSLGWKKSFQGSCRGNLQTTRNNESNSGSAMVICMHPKDDKFIYLYLHFERQIVSCDTRSGCIELMERLQDLEPYYTHAFHRLQLQWWPTVVPTLCLSDVSQ